MAKDDVTIYHNPRCSKSRQTLALLRDQGVEPRIVEYLQDPPSPSLVLQLARMLGRGAHDLLRTKEAAYAEAGLSAASTADEIAAAIATHPILLERPIVVAGDAARIGRPPEDVLQIL